MLSSCHFKWSQSKTLFLIGAVTILMMAGLISHQQKNNNPPSAIAQAPAAVPQSLPGDVAMEWNAFDAFIASRKEFNGFNDVSLHQLSARPKGEHTELCLALRHHKADSPVITSPVCLNLRGEDRFHFSLIRENDVKTEGVHYHGQSYSNTPMDDQLHTLFDAYGNGLFQLALYVI